jgi:hypothetical protein
MTSPRRLTFVVGTSLLTASLASGCHKSQPTVNPRPEPPHVNTVAPAESPADEATTDAPETEPEQPDDGPNVNTVPSDE